jgi:hypothetical protein
VHHDGTRETAFVICTSLEIAFSHGLGQKRSKSLTA